MRLIRSQGILVTAVIGFIAAVDTSRFERVEDGKHVGVYRRVLVGLNSFSGVIIVIIQTIRQKKGSLIYKFC